jgi:hypothetical protein
LFPAEPAAILNFPLVIVCQSHRLSDLRISAPDRSHPPRPDTNILRSHASKGRVAPLMAVSYCLS